MSTLVRDFNIAERILLIILGVLAVGVAYYYLVHLQVDDDLRAARVQRDDLTVRLDEAKLRAAQLRKMKDEMDELYVGQGLERMESYNNSKAEITLLNDVLAQAGMYSITFNGVTREGDQIRRSFNLSFTADSYETAEKILTKISESSCRCLIGDMNCTTNKGDEAVNYTIEATFYETMVGGKADAGLPKDVVAAS